LPATVDLLDANLWLALVHEKHTYHGRAQRFWEREALPLAAFCRVTEMAFLRHLTNKTIMGDDVLSPTEAWSKSHEFRALPEVRFLAEPAGLEVQWGAFSDLGRTSPNLWTDAYLAAFAKCAGLRLVTFDQGFARFAGLESQILMPDA
jgi:toxin-antitoxin system PIN domain toxin